MDDKLHEERKRLEEINRISNIIRVKCKLIKTNASEHENAIQEFFKPVVTPLKDIIETTKNSKSEHEITKINTSKNEKPKKEYYPEISDDSDEESVHDYEHDNKNIEIKDEIEKAAEVAEPEQDEMNESIENIDNEDVKKRLTYYINLMKKRNKYIDLTSGLRILLKGLYIGDKQVRFQDNNIVFNDGNKIKITMGLLELIFKQDPNETFITKSDKEKYKSLILLTNAHRKNYKAANDVRLKDYKYIHVISKLLDESSGKGLPEYMEEKKCKSSIDYLYYKDANQLVERLQLLTASRAAGNTNHSNEILSILDELRENKIIY